MMTKERNLFAELIVFIENARFFQMIRAGFLYDHEIVLKAAQISTHDSIHASLNPS